MAINNLISGGIRNGDGLDTFSTVTSKKFGCVTLGFLTYLIPLFIGQLLPLLGDILGTMIPGSTEVAEGMVLKSKRARDETKYKAKEGEGRKKVHQISHRRPS